MLEETDVNTPREENATICLIKYSTDDNHFGMWGASEALLL